MGKTPQRLKVYIRERRDQIGMRQRELAEAVGLSEAQVSKIENNDSDIGLINLHKFATALGCHELELFFPPGAHPTLFANYRLADPETREEIDQISHALVETRRKRGKR